ncbi:MAG: hypothetical protein ACLSVD_08415 [Eggerthellaceae bacterium]
MMTCSTGDEENDGLARTRRMPAFSGCTENRPVASSLKNTVGALSYRSRPIHTTLRLHAFSHSSVETVLPLPAGAPT